MIVSLGHLVGRKRHADVLRALWTLRDRHPHARYVIVGDGPERGRLERLAHELGLAERVELRGQLPHDKALDVLGEAALMALPSVDEALGVAYLEAMAACVPAIGSTGEPGPEDIAAAGDGLLLVPPGDIEALAERIDALLSDQAYRGELGARGRETVERSFSWERCGEATIAAYEEALAAS
jgi:glycosyltransferase involved in cell wall biosynthesis